MSSSIRWTFPLLRILRSRRQCVHARHRKTGRSGAEATGQPDALSRGGGCAQSPSSPVDDPFPGGEKGRTKGVYFAYAPPYGRKGLYQLQIP